MPKQPSFTNINPDILDQQVYEHSDLYFEKAAEHAEAKAAVEDRKKELEIIEAELVVDINANPKGFKLPDKPTVGLVKSVVMLDADYQKAWDKYNKALADAAMSGVAVSAMDHRKSMLGKAVDLEVSSYHSAPRIRSASREVVEERNANAVRRPVARRQ